MFTSIGKWKTFDTTYLTKYLPIFQEKLGKDKPLKINLRAKNFDVKFREYDTDVILT